MKNYIDGTYDSESKDENEKVQPVVIINLVGHASVPVAR